MAFNFLLVDDSRTVRAVVMKCLRLAKVPTRAMFEAGNGAEALEVVAREWIDLIFADINMPVMNGLEMIERLQDDPTAASIPVVVISTEGSEARIAELQAKGVRAYLRKPFKPEELRDVVRDILEVCDG